MADSSNESSGLAWTSHPAREQPAKTIGLLAFMALFLVLVYVAFGSPFYVLAGGLFLIGALFPYLTPTRYRLNDEGVEIDTLIGRTRRPWDTFRVYRRALGQVILCTRKIATKLDRYRGCRLVLSGNRDEVEAFLEARGIERREPEDD